MARDPRAGAPGGGVGTIAPPPPALLPPPLLNAVRAAGRAIMRHYRPGVAKTYKPDGSPVTAADHAAEAIILDALRAIDETIPVVAEESFAAGRVPDVTGKRFWLVDPLDGTKEFLKANGEFSVNVGLVEDRRPVLGVVHAPASGEMFWCVGGKAYARKGDGPEREIRARAAPAGGLVVAASRSHDNRANLDAFLAGMKVAEIRVSGSAIKFCRVAAGEADLYPRLGPTMEWDSCAGHAIVLAAGGSVATLDGAPLVYAKPGFLNPGYVARGR
ncbi:MAG: 3'(2'),5'-bisphosphate nucleotidase CysQ [Rhodospirillales bacterium]